jgi:hypothetical protein
MRRFVDPAILAFAVALIASLGIHLPAYQVLGVLADRLFEEAQRRVEAPTQIEFELPPDGEDEAAAEPPETESLRAADPPSEADPEERRVEKERPKEKPKAKAEAKAEAEKPKPEDAPKPEPAKPAESQPMQVERVTKHAVRQHSQDPNVPPPENADFISDQNNRVEEQTVAQIRNDVRDDETPSPGPSESSEETPDPGNAEDSVVAHLREMEGSDARAPTPEEAEEDRPEEVAKVDPSPIPVGSEQRGSDGPAAESGARGPEGDSRDARSARAARSAEHAGPEGANDAVYVHDGFGTLRIDARRPGRAEAEGGEGDARQSRQAQRARQARSGRHGGGDGRYDGIPGVTRRFAWSELQDAYGRDRLDEEREAYLAEHQSKKRGGHRQKEWKNFRAAIENFVPNVKPGNQTALNAAASPFAAYLSDVHRRIHREFADKFLAGLPTYSTSPFADPSLLTRLEIILNRDGTVHRVGVIKTSGFLPYDYGAWRAVMRGQPYPEPPLAILSGDGRVYMHWGFYRNHRQCGTFNAEPFILPNPPGVPTPGGPLQDKPEWGGVVPRDAKPTWGTDAEKGKGDGPAPAPDGAPDRQRAPGGDGEREGDGDRNREPKRRPDGEPPPRRVRPGGAALG